jgi:hypothetical protein
LTETDDGEPLALTKAGRRALHTRDNDRHPLAPRLDPLKAILAKLEPPKPAPPKCGRCQRAGG